MANVPENRSSEQSYLHHNETIASNRLSAYYGCFTTHLPFQQDMDALDEKLSETLIRAAQEEADSAAEMVSDPQSWVRRIHANSPDDQSEANVYVWGSGMSQAARNDLVQFAAQWRLPIRTGYFDVWRALLSHRPGEAYELSPTPRADAAHAKWFERYGLQRAGSQPDDQ
jgi:hypothetical protein